MGKINFTHGETWTAFLKVNNGKTRIPKRFIYCDFHGISGLFDAGGLKKWNEVHAQCQGHGNPLTGGAALAIPEDDEKPRAMRKAA